MPIANIGGDLASWSTVILYGITILLMIFTGMYYMNVENEDEFRWKNKNSIITPFVFYNLVYFIILVVDLCLIKISGVHISTVFICLTFFLILIFMCVNFKIENPNAIEIKDIISICFKSKNFVIVIYGMLTGLMYVELEVFLFYKLEFVFILFVILLNIGLTFAFMYVSKEILYSLKEYIVYLTDQKCYSAKLESIKEGFLVLSDVKLYNGEIAERSIDKLKPESFEVETIINRNNKKTIIIPTKMIIPKEQVLAMYIVDTEKNTEKSTGKFGAKELAIILIFVIFIIIVLILIPIFQDIKKILFILDIKKFLKIQ